MCLLYALLKNYCFVVFVLILYLDMQVMRVLLRIEFSKFGRYLSFWIASLPILLTFYSWLLVKHVFLQKRKYICQFNLDKLFPIALRNALALRVHLLKTFLKKPFAIFKNQLSTDRVANLAHRCFKYSRITQLAQTEPFQSEPFFLTCFSDEEDALFMWDFEPTHPYTWLGGTIVIIIGFLGVLYPLWPQQLRGGVYYLSWGGLGFVGFVIVLAILRTILYCLIWALTGGKHHLWIFPNLTEDCGPIESFFPIYSYKYTGKNSV